jgi:hypothetical protein
METYSKTPSYDTQHSLSDAIPNMVVLGVAMYQSVQQRDCSPATACNTDHTAATNTIHLCACL